MATTKVINGYEYRLRDGLRASYLLRLAKTAADDRGFLLLHEMLLDTNGNKYADLDAVAESIRVQDFAELMDAVKAATGVDWDALAEHGNTAADPLAT